MNIFLFFRLLRVNQYTKNFFVYLPLFFSGMLFDSTAFYNTFLMFLAFCCISSVIYILNDIKDIEEDKHHPTKCKRPIVAGDISKPLALSVALILLSLSFFISYTVAFSCLKIICLYFSINIFYVFWAKRYAIIDVACIALGFVLRTIGGSFAISEVLSQWLTLMVFLLCMFLAIGKRWDDLCINEKEQIKGEIRTSLQGYTKMFVVSVMTFLSSINTVCYIMYTMAEKNIQTYQTEFLYTTAFWVVLGNIRYLQVAFVKEASASPSYILLHDAALQFVLLGWIIHLSILLYL